VFWGDPSPPGGIEAAAGNRLAACMPVDQHKFIKSKLIKKQERRFIS